MIDFVALVENVSRREARTLLSHGGIRMVPLWDYANVKSGKKEVSDGYPSDGFYCYRRGQDERFILVDDNTVRVHDRVGAEILRTDGETIHRFGESEVIKSVNQKNHRDIVHNLLDIYAVRGVCDELILAYLMLVNSNQDNNKWLELLRKNGA